jgi:hypothetical protein
MDVYNSARERLEHGRFEDPHESGKHDQLHPGALQDFNQFIFHRWFEFRPKLPG